MTTINPFELWLDFKSWVNTQQGGFMPPQSVFIRVANIASFELWNRWTKEAEKSQEIRDYLLPFLKSKNVITVAANSFYATFTPPKDYGRFATAKILLTEDNQTVPSIEVDKGKCCKGTKVNIPFTPLKVIPEGGAEDYFNNTEEAAIQLIDNQKWSAVLQHLTKKPTFEKPKMTEINGGFKVAPRDVSVVVLNYYIEPQDAIFGYTPAPGSVQTGSGGAIVYNPNTSRNFQWGITVKPFLLKEIQDTYIRYTRDGAFASIVNAQKK